MYISDVIGNEYLKWNPETKVFISSPTGTGKTTFITKSLFPFAVENKKRIVYLVNRTALEGG